MRTIARVSGMDFSKDSMFRQDANRYPEKFEERMDFEFVNWDSKVDIVDSTKTMEELLNSIYDQYPLNVLSFIFRKSICQIQSKMQELGLKNFIEHNTAIAKVNAGEIRKKDHEISIIIHQQDNDHRNLEQWFVNNNNIQMFSYDDVKIQKMVISDTIKYFIDNKQYEMLFKFLVNVCNLAQMSYRINVIGVDMILTLNFEQRLPTRIQGNNAKVIESLKCLGRDNGETKKR